MILMLLGLSEFWVQVWIQLQNIAIVKYMG